jgi:hypothetical protein
MTCGYVCPLCEGKGMDSLGKPCSWCRKEESEWVSKVHGDCSCSDIGKEDSKEKEESQQNNGISC